MVLKKVDIAQIILHSDMLEGYNFYKNLMKKIEAEYLLDFFSYSPEHMV